ncbi:lymphatic vessel endothelial hyaluronic acid receptor 1a [Mastacembelus armatus]|uniref:Lymphatic vessel endothelial hyaluronic receptor 1a n=1 Tax=Mastacembelus armatus TaxID=205130 RepID=A0A7N8WYY3_9TELE|nr:lymphatic vessel endothelial hyaluronic acid receptor 1 [Mastacembelus armatus]
MIWLCITLGSVTSVIFGQNIDIDHIRVFPAVNQSIAGVFQVSYLNDLHQPSYGFNASEARRLCLFLGVTIASKAQVQEALRRGLETCRFGWTDEHLAVIPRIKPLTVCGQNQIGLVTWRATVTHPFDAFCFNESDAAIQLMHAANDRPLSSSRATNSITHSASSSSHPSSSSSSPKIIDSESESAHFVSSAQGSPRGKVALITSTCALLLVAVIFVVYLKLRRSCSWSSDMRQQQESTKTEEWTCVKIVKETKKDAQEDERIEVGDDAS